MDEQEQISREGEKNYFCMRAFIHKKNWNK
jgi:hypothetical protein